MSTGRKESLPYKYMSLGSHVSRKIVSFLNNNLITEAQDSCGVTLEHFLSTYIVTLEHFFQTKVGSAFKIEVSADFRLNYRTSSNAIFFTLVENSNSEC